MNLEVYCDEAHPDAFVSGKTSIRFLMIGSLWIPGALRAAVKEDIAELRRRHRTWGEIKWHKVSHDRQSFYRALIDLFLSYGEDLRFRCIAVDRRQMDLRLHDGDGELGFYKFYYQMLHHWILDFNEYSVFCDAKTNRDPRRLSVLHRCLSYSNLSSAVRTVQSLPSREVVLIQLCDLLLGAASSRLNATVSDGSAKDGLVGYLEEKLGKPLRPTSKTEEKFNIFRIRLQGGW